MGQALYRKYRSRSLGEIVGQKHVTDTLESALKSGRISHAYLFTGPRGVGKTSIARILAHAINDLPYDEESSHIDIIEIDAASNRGIDEIRDLREKVYIAPAVGKYKVYIIDEVHMLTSQAFNALLKTLEEPPAHVVFILATTEAHKLPATIISRTQRYTFRPAQKDDVVAHLRSIAKKEKITIDDAALQAIAEHGDGSFRDSVGLLDQAADGSTAITIETVQQLLGLPSEQSVSALLEALQTGDIAGLSAQLAQLYEQGFQAAAITKHLAKRLRLQFIGQQPSQLPNERIIELLKNLLAVPTSPDPARLLELTLLGAIDHPQAAQPADRPDDPPTTTKPNAAPEPPAEPATAEPSAKSVKAAPSQSTSAFTSDVWPGVLTEIKKRYNTLYSILRMAQPSFSDETLTLSFNFAFHQKRINEAKNKKIITDIIEQLTGQGIGVVCIVESTGKKTTTTTSPKTSSKNDQPDSLKSVSNIFGGGELL